MQGKPLIAFAAGLAIAAAYAPERARATPMQVFWTTFLRNYPNENAMVIDEVAHDRIVEVLDCNDAWCRIEYGRAIGYIESGALAGNIGRTALRGPLNPNTGCFWAESPSYVGTHPEEFCGVTANTPATK